MIKPTSGLDPENIFSMGKYRAAFAVMLGLEVAICQSAPAQTFSVLHRFTGSPDNGNWMSRIY
ncbi:MAG TPA: hypothetical protein VN948_13250 [Terriglobales bacterium]|nr:hypothetical protein [Terriglobales bacterium]